MSSNGHEPFIKTPKQLITVVALAFVVPIIIIIMLASWVNSGNRDGAGSNSTTPEAIAARIKPVAGLALKGEGGAKALKAGADVYNAQCSACHAAGVAGSPKFGDAGAWAARIKTGYEALVNSALKGKGAMAAQGGGDYEDLEIARAVVHMANAAGAKFADAKDAPSATATAVATPTASVPAPSTAAVSAAPAAAAVAVAAASGAAKPSAGKALYESACTACHAAGVAGAPKFGDAAAWAPRAKLGVDSLVQSVIKGKGAMPAKGGRPDASDADIKASVEFMLAAVK
jgi:cytochrome c5